MENLPNVRKRNIKKKFGKVLKKIELFQKEAIIKIEKFLKVSKKMKTIARNRKFPKVKVKKNKNVKIKKLEK